MFGLRQDNPYSIGYVINYEDGTNSLERFRIKYTKSVGDRFHIVTEADSMWSLAYDYYGNSKYYWVIQDVNDLENAWSLVVGDAVIIPDLVKIKATVLS